MCSNFLGTGHQNRYMRENLWQASRFQFLGGDTVGCFLLQ